MTTIHAEWVGDKAILSRLKLEKLLELARKNEDVQMVSEGAEVSTSGLMLLAQQGGALDFLADEEDLYTLDDLKVAYR